MPGKSTNHKLSKKDLEFFKDALEKLRYDITHDIRNMRDSSETDSRDQAVHVQHMADVATDIYEKEFNLGLASKEHALLSKIDDALKRIGDGTFGRCLATGTPISLERLKAIPYAEYCLEYQEKLEKQGR